MRKRFFVGLLGFVLTVCSLSPFFKSEAANAPQQNNVSKKGKLPSSKLPDYGIRLVGKNEFLDGDFAQASSKQIAECNVATQLRASVAKAFRSSLPGGTEMIINPGFEPNSSLAPWFLSGQVKRSTGAFPHSGLAYMILGGVNSTTGRLYQTITIPSGTATNLTFWLNITTSRAAGATVFDPLFIEVRSTSGTLLATLATFSNQNSSPAGIYVLRGPYSLSAFAGQTVRIQFRATNDVSLPTSFRVDDVSAK
jgi:bacillolysin